MTDILGLTSQIVSAHVSKNAVEPDQLPELVKSVFAALTKAARPQPEQQTKEPAVPVRKSVFNDHLVCLECGKSFHVMKRHLEREHGITAEEYRKRFDLSHDYPLVAPDVAAVRAQIAKRIGLGRQEKAQRGRKAHAQQKR